MASIPYSLKYMDFIHYSVNAHSCPLIIINGKTTGTRHFVLYVFISRRAKGPGREILKTPLVRLSVRPSVSHV